MRAQIAILIQPTCPMLNPNLKLNEEIFLKNVELKSTRSGFGDGLVEAGKKDERIVVLCNDLTESTKVDAFAKKFPNRFIEVGIAEQNMASIAAGLALSGKVPFIASHAIFVPSRNWDQIRLSICIGKANVKIAGTHAGFSNGKDGAVAESLEDIALMRVLPNMTVVNPIDYQQAKTATLLAAQHQGPIYLRFSRENTPLITTEETPFIIGKNQVLVEGNDITIISCGPIIYEVLAAVKELRGKNKITAEVISCPTIKPLDEKTILDSAKKTGKVVTVEEHQINGGLGSAVAELLSEKCPVPLTRIGVNDTFGESGSYSELKDKYGLSSHHIAERVTNFIKKL